MNKKGSGILFSDGVDFLTTIEEVVVKTPLCEEDLQEGCRLMGDLSGMGLDIIAHLKKTKDILNNKGKNE